MKSFTSLNSNTTCLQPIPGVTLTSKLRVYPLYLERREAFANSSGYHVAHTGSLGSSGYGSSACGMFVHKRFRKVVLLIASASLESLGDPHRNFFRSSSAGNSSSINSVTLLHPSSAVVQPLPLLHRTGSSCLTGSNTPIVSLNLSASQQPIQSGTRSQVLNRHVLSDWYSRLLLRISCNSLKPSNS